MRELTQGSTNPDLLERERKRRPRVEVSDLEPVTRGRLEEEEEALSARSPRSAAKMPPARQQCIHLWAC